MLYQEGTEIGGVFDFCAPGSLQHGEVCSHRVCQELRLTALQRLEDTANDCEHGRGIPTVDTIVKLARRDDWKHAQSIRIVEGDKTRIYPEVEAILAGIFGCRSHGLHNCPDCHRFG